MTPNISTKRRWEVFETHDNKCVVCGSSNRLEIHHLVAKHKLILKLGLQDDPRYKEVLIGSDHPENLVPLCHVCHDLATFWINPNKYSHRMEVYKALVDRQDQIAMILDRIQRSRDIRLMVASQKKQTSPNDKTR